MGTDSLSVSFKLARSHYSITKYDFYFQVIKVYNNLFNFNHLDGNTTNNTDICYKLIK